MSSGLKLISLFSTSDGIDFVVEAQSMERYLNPKTGTLADEGTPQAEEHKESIRTMAIRRRAELAHELRSLARALEVPTWPFSNDGTPDPLECRGQAEREIDALAEHIIRLETQP